MHPVISGPMVARHAGTLLRRVDLRASVLTSTAYAPQLRLPHHAHTSAFMVFVRDGAFVEQYGRRSERYDRWSCIYRPRLDEHANDFGDGGAILTAIDVNAEWVERLREAGFSGERFSVRSPFVQQFRDRLEAELAMPDSMSDMIVEALAIEVIVFGARCVARREGPWAQRARRLIEQHFASPLSLGVIANEVGVHPVHLARQFRASEGCTVGEYIRRVRVAFAQRELLASDKPIAEIALAAGFSDQSQLTKSFKRITGQTPAACRARQR
ncbi:MAG TPA: AraC family transcriptional regulator [Thermoanaerobaculia bacterium]|nr:AraC family transcriptional regulator [Thermoanaerobaculia bacterium]